MKNIHTTLSTQICLKKYFNKHIQNGRQGRGEGNYFTVQNYYA